MIIFIDNSKVKTPLHLDKNKMPPPGLEPGSRPFSDKTSYNSSLAKASTQIEIRAIFLATEYS